MRKQRRNVDVNAVVVDLPIAHPPNCHGRDCQGRVVLARIGYFEPRDDYVVECPDIKQPVLDTGNRGYKLLRILGDICAADDRVVIGIDKRAVFRQEAS